MSAEAFDTLLVADAKTAPDGRGVLWGEHGENSPRWPDDRRNGWASVKVNAEHAVRIAAQAVGGTHMDGLTGDHERKRRQLERVMQHVATAIRILALDVAHDQALTEERWLMAMIAIEEEAAHP